VARNLGIYRSIDNGANWGLFTVGITNLDINCLGGDLNGTLYLGTSGLFKSTNQAQTWSQITSFPEVVVKSILAIPSTQTIFVGTNDGVYRSVDKGTNWQLLSNGFPSSSGCYDIAHLSNGDFLASVGSPSFSGVYRSTDNGDSWSPTTGNIAWVTKIRVDKCNNNIYMIFSSGWALWRSTDNGYSWETKEDGIITNIIYDIAINSLGHIYITTQASLYPSAMKSTDQGNSWENISSGVSGWQLSCLLISTNGYIFAGTDDVYILHNGHGIFRSVNPTFTPPFVSTDILLSKSLDTCMVEGKE
jgi:photosystem II stability/assembly factor-like uncharacterized protein